MNELSDVDPNDLEAIAQLHRRDVAATRAGDVEVLKSLMDAQCIVFPPERDPASGQTYLDQVWPPQDVESQPDIVELVQDWQELRVFGDFAYQHGVVRYVLREKDGNVIRETQRLLRILRRQADGTWRVYRAMWHPPRPAPEDG